MEKQKASDLDLFYNKANLQGWFKIGDNPTVYMLSAFDNAGQYERAGSPIATSVKSIDIVKLNKDLEFVNEQVEKKTKEVTKLEGTITELETTIAKLKDTTVPVIEKPKETKVEPEPKQSFLGWLSGLFKK